MKKCFSWLLTMSLLLTTLPSAFAQTTNHVEKSATDIGTHDWQGMYGITAGTKLVVELKGGGKGEGKVVSLAGNKLTLVSNSHIYSFEQSGIKRIYGFKGRSRGKTARIGMGIGMVVGTSISVARAIENERTNNIPANSDGTPSFAGFVIGALAGAGVAALFGGRRKKELLYEAK